MSLSPANLIQGQQPQYAQQQQYAPQSGPGLDPALVQRVAARFAADRRDGGMVGVAADVRRCYQSAGGNRAALADCIVLDFVAGRREAYNRQQFRTGTTDYFTPQAIEARITRASPALGMDNAGTARWLSTNSDAVYARAAQL